MSKSEKVNETESQGQMKGIQVLFVFFFFQLICTFEMIIKYRINARKQAQGILHLANPPGFQLL